MASQSNSKYTKILNQFEKFDITHDSIKSLSRKIFDLDSLQLLDEKKITTPPRADLIKKENKLKNDEDNEPNSDLIDNQSRLQIEKLNKSFDLLIKNASKSNIKDKIESKNEEISKKTLAFNQSIKAYVDVCCQIPGLVSCIVVF